MESTKIFEVNSLLKVANWFLGSSKQLLPAHLENA